MAGVFSECNGGARLQLCLAANEFCEPKEQTSGVWDIVMPLARKCFCPCIFFVDTDRALSTQKFAGGLLRFVRAAGLKVP